MSDKPLAIRELAIRTLDVEAFSLIHRLELTTENCDNPDVMTKALSAAAMLDTPTQLLLIGGSDIPELWTENGHLAESVPSAAGVTLFRRVVRMAPKPKWVAIDQATEKAQTEKGKGTKSSAPKGKRPTRKSSPKGSDTRRADTTVSTSVNTTSDRPKPGPHLHVVRSVAS